MAIISRKIFNFNQLLWLFVLFVTLLVQLTDIGLSARFDRELIESGHYWLLLSGNFVHLNWSHWALNMAGLAIVAFFFSIYGTILQWISVVSISAVFVGLGLYWFNPNIYWYVGLSGVLHGLFIFGVLREIKVYPGSGAVLLMLIVGKLLWEIFNGALPGSEEMTGGNVITDSHLYGAIGGAVSMGLIVLFLRCKKTPESTT